MNATARESGLVTRRRKVAPADLFWTLVLGFAVGHRRTLASLRRFFQASTAVGLVPSSFYDLQRLPRHRSKHVLVVSSRTSHFTASALPPARSTSFAAE